MTHFKNQPVLHASPSDPVNHLALACTHGRRPTRALRLNAVALGCLGLVLASTGAWAQAESYSYGGLSVGRSRAPLPFEQITQDRLLPGQTLNALTRDEKDTAFRLFGGLQFNRYLGLEAGLFDLGKFSFGSVVTPAGSLNGQVKVRGLSLDLVGTMPITENLSALARVGAQYARTRSSLSSTGAVLLPGQTSFTERETNPKVGLGLQYAFSPGFMMRGEIERYRINDALGRKEDVNVASLSLVFPFGRAAEPARMSMAPAYTPAPAPALAPAPVAQVMPAPAPIATPVAPQPAPMVPERRRVSFSAESLFGFDASAVRPEGKTALDSFVREVAGSRYDSISIEGHTDRLGSSDYNQNLSLQRAESVKDYLVRFGGLEAAKLHAVGMGQNSPTTKDVACGEGEQATQALKACLQPDRRVEIEVSATK